MRIKIRFISSKTIFTHWFKSDFELLDTPFERSRPAIPGQPQTVNALCTGNPMELGDGHYQRLVMELNPGLTDQMMVSMMDKWMPENAKWGDGDRKIATDILFASNPVNVLGLIPNPGGLTGVPFGAMVYRLDVLDFNTLFMYTGVTIPKKYVMQFTVNLNGANVVNPVDVLGGRNGLPIKLPMVAKTPMYVRRELLDTVGVRTNRYNPPWKLGEF